MLVNNAGIFIPEALTAASIGVWNQTVAINQTGVFLGMRAVAPHICEQRVARAATRQQPYESVTIRRLTSQLARW